MFDNFKKTLKKLTKGIIKWSDFLATFFMLIFGSIILVILLINPLMLTAPFIPFVLGFGFVILPIAFRVLSSLTIQLSMHETYSISIMLCILFLIFSILLFICARYYLSNPEILGRIKNLPTCLANCEITNITDMASQAVDSTVQKTAAQTANVLEAKVDTIQKAAAQTGDVLEAKVDNAVQKAAVQTGDVLEAKVDSTVQKAAVQTGNVL